MHSMSSRTRFRRAVEIETVMKAKYPREKHEKRVVPHRCQHLGGEFYAKESTKPLFKLNELMTVHNLYRFRCIMETMKIVKTHVPISMYVNQCYFFHEQKTFL